jgi:hypothetical protein
MLAPSNALICILATPKTRARRKRKLPEVYHWEESSSDKENTPVKRRTIAPKSRKNKKKKDDDDDDDDDDEYLPAEKEVVEEL